MKSISIRRKSTYTFMEKPESESGFTINFSEEDTEAALFLTGEDESSKLIPKCIAEQFWNQVRSSVNLQKVLEESSERLILDGDYLVLELEMNCQSLCLTLHEPDKDEYLKCGMTDSYKLMVLIEELIEGLNSCGGDLK